MSRYTRGQALNDDDDVRSGKFHSDLQEQFQNAKKVEAHP